LGSGMLHSLKLEPSCVCVVCVCCVCVVCVYWEGPTCYRTIQICVCSMCMLYVYALSVCSIKRAACSSKEDLYSCISSTHPLERPYFLLVALSPFSTLSRSPPLPPSLSRSPHLSLPPSLSLALTSSLSLLPLSLSFFLVLFFFLHLNTTRFHTLSSTSVYTHRVLHP